jgi:predicted transglutaminase-like cysteine proteinase
MSVCRKPDSQRKVLRRVGTLIALAATLGAAGAAAAPAPRPMPLGPSAAPPSGFLDFCRRQPADCGLDPAEARERIAPARQDSAWTRRFAAARLAPAAVESRQPITPGGGAQPAPAMTPGLWSLVQGVNREVNRAVVRRSDQAAYGAADRWATPLAEGRRFGDCEDYVLEKRRALIAAGVPAETLNIALATTRWGEAHAVLLLSAGGGEYVLDNLEPWILPWDQAPYRWRARQVGGDPIQWVRAAAD